MRVLHTPALLGIALLGLACATPPPPAPPPGPTFAAGQVWTYTTRKNKDEEASRLTVLAVDKLMSLGTVVHVQVSSLHLESDQTEGQDVTTIRHMPFSNYALTRSVLNLERTEAAPVDFEESRLRWLKLAESGQAGLFTESVVDAIDYMEKMLQYEDKKRRKKKKKKQR